MGKGVTPRITVGRITRSDVRDVLGDMAAFSDETCQCRR
jgi:hypothetical protein